LSTCMDTAQRRLIQIAQHLKTAPYPSLYSAAASSVTSATSQKNGLLNGQVAIITGSGQGIGEACALLFAREGAKVVVTDLDEAKAVRVAQQITSAGGSAIAVPGDVTDEKYPDRIIQETIKAFGKLNIIVNNAGYTWDGMLHKMTDKQWNAMLAVHNTAPFRLLRAAAPYMRDAAKKEQDEGKTPENRAVVNVSSTSGLHGNIGQANYATAKLGVVGFTKTVAKEWGAFGIRCNAVAFGFVDTRLTRPREDNAAIEVDGKKISLGIPKQQLEKRDWSAVPLGRGGRADEAASSVLFLASPLASYVTGHTLEVTGGFGI